MYIRLKKERNEQKQTVYRKTLIIGNRAVMEYANEIVCVAVLRDQTDRSKTYHITVARDCWLGPDYLVRSMKNFIGNSRRFDGQNDSRRNLYKVTISADKSLPYTPMIIF